MASMLAAMSCCLPLGTVVLAAGTAGVAALLDALRPYLMGLSALLLGFAFWQTYRRRACTRSSRWQVGVLWTSLVLLLGFLLFPQQIAGLVADALPAEAIR